MADHQKNTSKKNLMPSKTVVANIMEDAKTKHMYFMLLRSFHSCKNQTIL